VNGFGCEAFHRRPTRPSSNSGRFKTTERGAASTIILRLLDLPQPDLEARR
jgi:hypothetical protein